MVTSTRPTQQQLHEQIKQYKAAYDRYERYAVALARVLKDACRSALPEAIIQARAKSPARFAEKCVRKFGKYKDPVRELTDLCGGRVIVQTLANVIAVRMFIEDNFRVLECEDKGLLLGENEFGYRDVHYLIQLNPEKAPRIGFTADECSRIGDSIAELQVRSIVQHAWADILHDRIYKPPLKLSFDAKRTGALLAAIMEDGDRTFDGFAAELDGMAANYSAYASRENVENEIETQKLLLSDAKEANAEEAPVIALGLARLIASKAAWGEIVKLLKPYEQSANAIGFAIWMHLGHALCREHRATPSSSEYQRGQHLLRRTIDACEHPDLTSVPNLRRTRSIHARALAQLGWSYEVIDAEAYLARDYYRKAVEQEPENPYYLAEMLGFELKYDSSKEILAGFRSVIRSALATCRQHAVAGTELPMAYFTAGRLSLLLNEDYPALHDYACGMRHCLAVDDSRIGQVIQDEIAWLHRVWAGHELEGPYSWVKEMLLLATCVGKAPTVESPKMKTPVLVVAGGAASFPKELQQGVAEIFEDSLSLFTGTVISGGTTSGVPGALGEAAGKLKASGKKTFDLISYIPNALPHDAQKDLRYDRHTPCGDNQFTPAQVIRGWSDTLLTGVKPQDVQVIGFGGGKISALEYRLALALGATVGVISGSGGAADKVLKDPLWPSPPCQLFPLPNDPQTVRAFIVRDGSQFTPGELEAMGKEFHANYLKDNQGKIQPDGMKPWEILPTDYKIANKEQAAYVIRILQAVGFAVRKVVGEPVIFNDFTEEEIEKMAKLEHGRWNVERLRNGWRPGERNEEKKLHNYIVRWEQLPEKPTDIRQYDRDSVKEFPRILAKLKWEVYRLQQT